jgi:hypothetical protein
MTFLVGSSKLSSRAMFLPVNIDCTGVLRVSPAVFTFAEWKPRILQYDKDDLSEVKDRHSTLTVWQFIERYRLESTSAFDRRSTASGGALDAVG